MHGRVKVRTSEEQQALKNKERQEKLKMYLHLKEKIFTKRAKGEFDVEALTLTGHLLGKNPDFATVFNFRRDIMTHLFQSTPAEEKQRLCEKELDFLNDCLMTHPKSYSIWNQRRWIMENAVSPPWQNEQALCSKFLSLDERNFHCWDYRRFVVGKSPHPDARPEKEFEYTLEKIGQNFSNYSAWHYRSTLLPLVHPTVDGEETTHKGVAQSAIDEEFQTVKNAFYIDPNDQSAWFYHRWLLGRDAKAPVLCSAQAVRYEAGITVHIVFSQHVDVAVDSASVSVNGTPIADGTWSKPAAYDHSPSPIWTFTASTANPEGDAVSVDVHIPAVGVVSDSNVAAAADTAVSVTVAGGERDGYANAAEGSDAFTLLGKWILPSKELLQQELDSCEELLGDLDKDEEQKWPLLAIVNILYALDPVAGKDKIFAHLAKLDEVDTKRRGFYGDLRSRFLCEFAIAEEAATGNARSFAGAVDWSEKNLTSLYNTERLFLASSLNLSKNLLRIVDPCALLINVEALNLDDNSIATVRPRVFTSLPKLRTLSLRNNKLGRVDSLEGLVGLQLTELFLGGNDVVSLPSFKEFATASLPYLKD